jgi:hypothetical protein
MRTQMIVGQEETGKAKVMVVVCGELQGDESAGPGDRGEGGEVGFVELWGGRMGARVRKRGQGQRVQGALGGVLKELGFTGNQVFRL